MATSKKTQKDEDVVHYVSERKKRGRPKAKTQPQMTPMIDVTFQLLLFFLLTMEFRQTEAQIPAELPEQGGPVSVSPLAPDPVWVYVRHSETTPKVEMDGASEVMDSWPRLLQALNKRFADLNNNEKVPVFIKPDGTTSWAHSINAFQQAAESPFKIVAFAAELGQAEKGGI